MKDKVNNVNGDGCNKVAISGIAARLPECDNIEEFREKLFAGLDLVTDDDRRWPAGLYGLPARMGKIKNLEYFDATFFGIHGKQANVMDPQLRLFLECTYEAIIDAGYNPAEIRGTRTGVFVGVSNNEANEYWTSDPELVDAYGVGGCCRAMLANRISYAFDFKGPSYAIDATCSGGFYALEQAIAAIEDGRCDAAIVSGLNVLLKPTCSLQLFRQHLLSKNGQCRAFDESGEGYVRSEAIIVIYLQKSSLARRVYAHVVGAVTNNDGYKEMGFFHPNGEMQKQELYELYSQVGVNPSDVVYIETHGPGTKVGDPQELNALTDVFCAERQTPLLIGSVKTNMGHAEPAAGLSGLIKVILAMEQGVIPANLYYKNPHPDIPGLKDGRLKVVTENLPWNGGYVGINSFGLGGTNSHVLLQSLAKPKLEIKSTQPKLCMVSGRTEQAVHFFLEQLKTSADDIELLTLVNEIHKININGHNYRGYNLMHNGKSIKQVEEVTNTQRPIWFFYSGVGTQWPDMGKDMMKNDIFAATVKRCCKILNEYDYDLDKVLFHGNAQTFDNVVNMFVAITTMQCALTDVLFALNVKPNGIIGHSLGEVSCAYADGCFTLREAVLTAFFRGKAMLVTEVGAMAAVNLSLEECAKICPNGVYPVCHNSATNTTVAGTPELIEPFVKMLKTRNIFARVVPTAGQAFHCKYVEAALAPLQKYLTSCIQHPKKRSSKWISTSVPEAEWNTTLAKYNSIEYHMNNIISPVVFHEHSKYIPDDAIVIEVAPHGLFQSLFKTSLKRCAHISLTKRNHEDNLEFFMQNIGKLYMLGGQPDLSVLYPPISYPVSRGTPMLAPLVQWDHSTQWQVPLIESRKQGGQMIVKVDLNKKNDQYLLGHQIDGHIMFPPNGYLVLVWQTYAKILNVGFETLPVIMENIHFHRQTYLNTKTVTEFHINILEGTGDFEIRENNGLVVSGQISLSEDIEKEFSKLPEQQKTIFETENSLSLSQKDIYKEFRLRGYELTGAFHNILQSDDQVLKGKITWNNNWITFLSAVTQFLYLNQYHTKDLYLPFQLQKIIIDPKEHFRQVSNLNNDINLSVKIYQKFKTIQCGGIEIRSLTSSFLQKQQITDIPKLENYTFVAYENSNKLNRQNILTILLQNVIENSSNTLKLKITELTNKSEDILEKDITQIIASQPMIAYDYSMITNNILNENSINNLVIAKNLIHTKSFDILRNCVNSLKTGGMLLLLEPLHISISESMNKIQLDIVSKQVDDINTYLLVCKPIDKETIRNNSIVVKLTESNFNWIELIKTALEKSEGTTLKTYLVAENQKINGIMGLTLCLLKELNGENVRCIFIQDENAEQFSLTSKFYLEQLKKDLVCNVLDNGVWGTYRHLFLEHQTNETDKKLVENAFLNIKTLGDLSTFRWLQESDSYMSATRDVCRVYYASINIRDLILVTGKLPVDSFSGNFNKSENYLGSEFAGRDAQGNRVFGLASTHALATTVHSDPEFVWNIPDKWSMEDAATIPYTYGTVYYALIVRGRMRRGESILINGNTLAMSQAAITVAMSMNCTVFVTVNSDVKRRCIRNLFPDLPDSHIGTTRDTSFEQLITNVTDGQGVDLVFNHYSDQILQASVKCLARNGRFIEIGKINTYKNMALGTDIFSKNILFIGIMLDVLSVTNQEDKLEVKKLLQEGINNGVIQPLTRTVFNAEEIEEAFRYMISHKDVGKIMLRVREAEEEASKMIRDASLWAVPCIYFYPQKSYVIIGGLGGFGLELTNWLASRGARNILLTSRYGVCNGYQSLCIRRLQQTGCRILVSTQQVHNETDTQQLIKVCQRELGPIGGIFNLAAVFHDAYIENQTICDFENVCIPKIQGTINLDKVSRRMCPDLDHFVVFSSVASGRGNAGQTSYGYANSAMERVCEMRHKLKLPALAIQWGSVGEVGYLLDTLEGKLKEVVGTIPQTLETCFQALDYLMLQKYPVLSCHVLAEKFNKNAATNKVTMIETIGIILGLSNVKTIQPSVSLLDLGMESILESEIKQILELNYSIFLSAKQVRNLTFAELNEFSTKNSNI